MKESIQIDVRGLSCPEPVMMTMDAMDEYKGQTIKVLANEAHTRTNIEKMLKHQGISYASEEKNGEYEIVFAN